MTTLRTVEYSRLRRRLFHIDSTYNLAQPLETRDTLLFLFVSFNCRRRSTAIGSTISKCIKLPHILSDHCFLLASRCPANAIPQTCPDHHASQPEMQVLRLPLQCEPLPKSTKCTYTLAQRHSWRRWSQQVELPDPEIDPELPSTWHSSVFFTTLRAVPLLYFAA